MRKTLKNQTVRSPERIFVVEDHPIFREGLVQLLDREPGLTVCGEACDAEQALQAIARLKPGLVLIDLTLPGKSGLDLIRELRAADRKVKLLVVSMHEEAIYAGRVLSAGGDGYIMKQVDPAELVHAIREVLSGRVYVSKPVTARSPKAASRSPSRAKARPREKLGGTELEILASLGRGTSIEEISRRLNLTLSVLAAHCEQIQEKLELKSLKELIRYAVGWIETGAA